MPDAADNSGIAPTRLPVPSRQRAMDWSLVLASQGIPHFIVSPDESGRWHLQIASADVSRASVAIRQYEAENRTRPWQQHYLEGRVVFDWATLVWVAALIFIHALAEKFPFLEQVGVMHGADVSQGQWWRLITATQLHADWGHLASNLSIGFILLGLVMGRWGTATGMLAALLAGVGGNLANWVVRPQAFSLGSSTVVMGCVGLLALMPRTRAAAGSNLWRGLFGGLTGATMLFMLFGLDPRADVLAHAGSFAAGLALAFMLRAKPALTCAKHANLVAALLLAGLVLGAWAQALVHSANGHELPVGMDRSRWPVLGVSVSQCATSEGWVAGSVEPVVVWGRTMCRGAVVGFDETGRSGCKHASSKKKLSETRSIFLTPSGRS